MTSTAPAWLRSLSETALRLGLIVAFLIFLGLAVDRLRLIFLPVLGALILATALLPAKRRLVARGVPNAGATAVVVGGAIAVLAAVAYFTVNTVVAEFDELNVDIESGLEETIEWVGDAFGLTEEETDEAVDDIVSSIRDSAGNVAGGVFSGVRLAAEALAAALLLAVLLFLIVKDAERIQRAIARRLGREQRRDFLVLSTALWTTLGGYFRGVVVVATIDAVFIGLGLVVIGVPFALPLAVLTFFGAFIPIVGAILAGVAAILIALASEGVAAAVGVGVLALAVQQVEGNVLAPYIVGRAVSLHPAVIILAVATGGALWGILGALVAVPITAATVTVIDYYLNPRRPSAESISADGAVEMAAGREASDAAP